MSEELTIKEFAAELGVSASTIKRYIKDGIIESSLSQQGRLTVRLIPVSEIEKARQYRDPGPTRFDPDQTRFNPSSNMDQTQTIDQVQPRVTGNEIVLRDKQMEVFNRQTELINQQMELIKALHEKVNSDTQKETTPERKEASELFWKLIKHTLKGINRLFRIPE